MKRKISTDKCIVFLPAINSLILEIYATVGVCKECNNTTCAGATLPSDIEVPKSTNEIKSYLCSLATCNIAFSQHYTFFFKNTKPFGKYKTTKSKNYVI